MCLLIQNLGPTRNSQQMESFYSTGYSGHVSIKSYSSQLYLFKKRNFFSKTYLLLVHKRKILIYQGISCYTSHESTKINNYYLKKLMSCLYHMYLSCKNPLFLSL